jgi:ATP-dependent DNA ligase
MDEKDIVQRLGPPDKIVSIRQRMRSRTWYAQAVEISRRLNSQSRFHRRARSAVESSLRLWIYRRTDVTTALRFIRPCSPIRATKPPVGDAWLHEPKLDGYRLQIAKDVRQVRLYSRRGYDWNRRLAGLAEAMSRSRRSVAHA